MNAAKYYVYRNLHTGGFSIKYKGLVVDRSNQFVAENVTFKVNEKGRQRVIKEKSKNVHAYVVCDNYKNAEDKSIKNLRTITYNPYVNDSFMCNKERIFTAKSVFLKNGKCYLL